MKPETLTRECLCGSGDAELLTQDKGLNIWFCKRCTQIYAHPYPSDEELKQYYATEYRTENLAEEFQRRVEKKGPRILNYLEPMKADGSRDLVYGKRILAIGCGSGGILVKLKEAGASVVGYDLDVNATAFGRSQGLDIRDEMPQGPFDIVILSHVLEHLRRPDELLRELRTHLNPQGALYIEVPNVRPHYTGLSVHIEYAHCWYWDRDTLRNLLQQCGYYVSSEPPSSVPWAMIVIAHKGAPHLRNPKYKLFRWKAIEYLRRRMGK